MNTRRNLLRTLITALTGAAILLPRKGSTAANPRTLLSPTEPMAISIAYIENATKVDKTEFPSYRRGQSCTTCSLVEFGTGIQRGCKAVPGRLVKAGGWCKLWQLRGGD